MGGTVFAKKAMKAAAMKAMKTVGAEAKGTVLAKKAMKGGHEGDEDRGRRGEGHGSREEGHEGGGDEGDEDRGRRGEERGFREEGHEGRHEGHEVSCLRQPLVRSGSPMRGPAPVCGCLHTRRA